MPSAVVIVNIHHSTRIKKEYTNMLTFGFVIEKRRYLPLHNLIRLDSDGFHTSAQRKPRSDSTSSSSQFRSPPSMHQHQSALIKPAELHTLHGELMKRRSDSWSHEAQRTRACNLSISSLTCYSSHFSPQVLK